jgi:hypothetical protein
MSIRYRRVLSTILARVASLRSDDISIFVADEVERWPASTVELLEAAGALRPAGLDTAVVCRGCERRCHREVVMLDTPRPEGVAFTTCDLRVGFGPFYHSAQRLRRWISSRQLMAKLVAKKLQLPIRGHDPLWRRVELGTTAFGSHRRLLAIEFSGAAEVRVGASTMPLIHLLGFDATGLIFDKETLTAFAETSEDLQLGRKRSQPSIAARQAKRVLTTLRNDKLQRHLECLAREHPGLTKIQLARRIVKSGEFEGMTAATIARLTHIADSGEGGQ